MKHIANLLTVALPVLLHCMTAHAERATSMTELGAESKLLAYLTTSSETLESLRNLAVKWDNALGLSCAEKYIVEANPALLVIKAPTEMPAEAKHPTEGAWQYKFSAKRCANSRFYNVLVLASKGESPKFIPLIPGQTIGDPLLLRDTVGTLQAGIKAEMKARQGKECTDFTVTDSQLSAPPSISGGTVSSRYEEIWSIQYCGVERKIPICFSPKANGGMSFTTLTCKEVERRSQAQ